MRLTILILALVIAGCGKFKGERGTAGTAGPQGESGMNGQDGFGCTVEEVEEGALFTCPDGSTALVEHGKKDKCNNGESNE